MSTPISVLRDAMARSTALRLLAAAHDHWAEEEQVAIAEGRYAEAEGAHQFALLALRSYRAELDDPEPPLPPVFCPVCGDPAYDTVQRLRRELGH